MARSILCRRGSRYRCGQHLLLQRETSNAFPVSPKRRLCPLHRRPQVQGNARCIHPRLEREVSEKVEKDSSYELDTGRDMRPNLIVLSAFFRSLLFVLIFCFSAALQAQDNGLLWKLQSPQGKTSYLFGTMHTDDRKVTDISPDVEA